MVLIVGAYVDGLPTPSSSIFLINVASLYLAGGWVKCCSDVMALRFTFSFSETLGTEERIFSSPSDSFCEIFNNFPTANHPSNFIREPTALNT